MAVGGEIIYSVINTVEVPEGSKQNSPRISRFLMGQALSFSVDQTLFLADSKNLSRYDPVRMRNNGVAGVLRIVVTSWGHIASQDQRWRCRALYLQSFTFINSELKKAVAKLARTVWQLARKPAQAAGPYQALKMASLGYSWLSWVAQPSWAELRQHYFRMVRTDFPKVKICQKKSPKFWRRPNKINKISKKSFLDRSQWVLSESTNKNKNKIDPSLWKNLLLCCPNLEAVLLKYITILQASKITLLWLPFH